MLVVDEPAVNHLRRCDVRARMTHEDPGHCAAPSLSSAVRSRSRRRSRPHSRRCRSPDCRSRRLRVGRCRRAALRSRAVFVRGWVVRGWVVCGWVVCGWVFCGWVVCGWVVVRGWVRVRWSDIVGWWIGDIRWLRGGWELRGRGVDVPVLEAGVDGGGRRGSGWRNRTDVRPLDRRAGRITRFLLAVVLAQIDVALDPAGATARRTDAEVLRDLLALEVVAAAGDHGQVVPALVLPPDGTAPARVVGIDVEVDHPDRLEGGDDLLAAPGHVLLARLRAAVVVVAGVVDVAEGDVERQGAVDLLERVVVGQRVRRPVPGVRPVTVARVRRAAGGVQALLRDPGSCGELSAGRQGCGVDGPAVRVDQVEGAHAARAGQDDAAVLEAGPAPVLVPADYRDRRRVEELPDRGLASRLVRHRRIVVALAVEDGDGVLEGLRTGDRLGERRIQRVPRCVRARGPRVPAVGRRAGTASHQQESYRNNGEEQAAAPCRAFHGETPRC